MNIDLKIKPFLDPEFVPALLWRKAFEEEVRKGSEISSIKIAVRRLDGIVFRRDIDILSNTEVNTPRNLRYLERLIKFMVWSYGGYEILIAGCDELAGQISRIYSEGGDRAFDCEIIGSRIFGQSIQVLSVSEEGMPIERRWSSQLGRHSSGNRIGIDLGGSDRKCAAVIDGKVVFSTEIPWSPYFEKDASYHYIGILDSLRLAAEHLPSVDAIGVSSAGVYVNNEVRVASLFRGINDDEIFRDKVRPMFKDILLKEFPNVPYVVINDGEVTALAGSMSMGGNSILGIAMGTSLAAGYVDQDGRISEQINELAFAPIDYNENAPGDEWSGDYGCGVQYLSQQGIARLSLRAGFDFGEMADADQLEEVQKAMQAGCDRARKIYETVGVYLGYSIAHYAEFYHIETVIMMGRVMSGCGGQVIIDYAEEVLNLEFPELALQVNITQPNEAMKRHGQAVAAASLAKI